MEDDTFAVVRGVREVAMKALDSRTLGEQLGNLSDVQRQDTRRGFRWQGIGQRGGGPDRADELLIGLQPAMSDQIRKMANAVLERRGAVQSRRILT